MTSFAFILGCVPLWTASGAGSVARQIMGTAVIGGMLAASAIGIFFIPGIFYMVEKWTSAGKGTRAGHLADGLARAGRLMIGQCIQRVETSRVAHWVLRNGIDQWGSLMKIAKLLIASLVPACCSAAWSVPISSACGSDSEFFSRSGRRSSAAGADRLLRRSSLVAGVSGSESCRNSSARRSNKTTICNSQPTHQCSPRQVAVTRSSLFPQVSGNGNFSGGKKTRNNPGTTF